MFKTITMFVAICMIATLLPVSVAAENTVTINAAAQQSTTDNIVVTGNIAEGKELTVLAVRHTAPVSSETEALGLLEGLADGKIMYIDQVTSNGADHGFSFKLRNDTNAVTEGSYLIVLMGGTDASAVYTVIELVEGAPEDLAMTADSYTGNVEFTFTDDAAWRENLAVEVKSGEDTVDVTPVVAEGSIKLALPAGTYSVKFTSAGYYDVTKEITVADREAGTATLNVPDRGYYFDTEDITLTLAGGHADWADAITDAGIRITDEAGENDKGSYSAGAVTVDETGKFKVVFPEVTGYADIEDITFEVKSYGQAVADAAIALVTSAADETDETGVKWNITVPTAPIEGFAGDYTFAWAITPDADLTDNVYVINRPENADPELDEGVEYTLTLTVTVNDTGYIATKVCKVNEQGADTYTIAAADVTELKKTNSGEAYKIAGAVVATIKIPADQIDVTSQTVSVALDGGAYEMYYSPERTTEELVVFVGILRTNNADAATVAAIAEVVDDAEGATAIYYGKPSNVHTDANVTVADVNNTLALYKANRYVNTFTDAQYLAADVSGSAIINVGNVNAVLASYKSPSHKVKTGFGVMNK